MLLFSIVYIVASSQVVSPICSFSALALSTISSAAMWLSERLSAVKSCRLVASNVVKSQFAADSSVRFGYILMSTLAKDLTLSQAIVFIPIGKEGNASNFTQFDTSMLVSESS